MSCLVAADGRRRGLSGTTGTAGIGDRRPIDKSGRIVVYFAPTCRETGWKKMNNTEFRLSAIIGLGLIIGAEAGMCMPE